MANITFTREERELPIPEAMHNPEIRPRVLQYVANHRGINTAQARQFIEGELYRELGVTHGGGQNATLGQALAHMDNPHFGAPRGRAGGMLDRSPGEVFRDNRLLDQTIKAVSLEKGISYVEALEKIHRGLEMNPRTVRELFQNTGVNAADDVANDVKLLERADDEAAAAVADDTRKLAQEPTNAMGRVLLDSDADVGAMIGDPAEFERRFHRARRAAPNMYEAGDAGRKRFRTDDRIHLDSGLDLVRTLERGNELRSTGQRRAQVRRQLEQTLTGERDARTRVRMLDQEIAKLRGERDQLAPRARSAGTPGLRALDANAAHHSTVGLSPKAREIADRIRAQGPRDTGEALRLLDEDPSSEEVDQSARTQVFLHLLAQGDTPARSEPADATPPAGNRAWDSVRERVNARLKQLERPDSEYPRTLQEILAEDRAADQVITRRGPLVPVSVPRR